MTKNEEAFRAGKQDAESFLANELRRHMKMKLSDVQFQDWMRSAKALKAYDPFEIAASMDWAVNKSDFWSDWDFTMDKFVERIEKILAQYRGWARKQKVLEEKNGEAEVSPTCKILLDRYPQWTRPEILERETKERVAKEWKLVIKDCKKCKGAYYIPSTHPNIPKSVKVECRDCRIAKEKLYDRFHKEVKAELYA